MLSYDGKNWTETNMPQYGYDYLAAPMALYRDKPVMIGAYETKKLSDFNDTSLWRSNASFFEVFDRQTEEWSDLKRNPFFPEHTKAYWGAASVTKDDSFLVFGGQLASYNDKSSI